MTIIKYRKIWFSISAILVALSLFAIFNKGLNLGVDFRGGSITEVQFDSRPEQTQIEEVVSGLGLGGFSVRPAGESNYIIRTRELNVEEQQGLVEAIGNPSIERQNTVGPVAGSELQSKAVKAVVVVAIMILLFITFAFRKVSKPVSSWKYAVATIIALFHDVIIPVGVFAFLGIEIDLLFVSGLLAILGYSVHDTIVVFDRVRENLRINSEKKINEEFEITVGKAVGQTMTRSINTSLTILVVLLAIYFVGASATRDLSLLLILGTIVGVYSSIFIAFPLLVTFYKLGRK